MKFDGLSPVDDTVEIDNLIIESDSELPEGPFSTGKLFVKTGANSGLYIWNHESTWIKLTPIV